MIKKFHKHYSEGKLTLRDYLAAHRSILANDRTWLSYVRTALTLFIAGVTFIKFFNSQILSIVGWVFVPIGVVVLIIGFLKYRHVRSLIHGIKDHGKEIKNI